MPTKLELIAADIRACRICVDNPIARPLPHEPRPVVAPSATARILIAGQAPGAKAHASGRPFTDASGDRLRDWLGVTSETFHDPRNFAMVPMGFCFPGQDAKGGDLPPRFECAAAWRAPLIALMPKVDLVLAIGFHAQAWHLGAGRSSTLTDTVRNWRTIYAADGARKVIALPHPSWRNNGWIRKNLWFEAELLPFLKAEVRSRIADTTDPISNNVFEFSTPRKTSESTPA